MPDASVVPLEQLMLAKGRVRGCVGLWSMPYGPPIDLCLHIPSCGYFHYRWFGSSSLTHNSQPSKKIQTQNKATLPFPASLQANLASVTKKWLSGA